MPVELNAMEIRVLGCLIEKQLATPDYYPLTLNSLVAACNQKSNREPVMQASESEVLAGIKGLLDRYLIREKQLPGSRTVKYEHKLSGTLTREYDFGQQELAILAVLFLRGPQTLGEIKARTQRMAEFEDLAQVEQCIQALNQHSKGPFVAALPREPGRREVRYTHLFGSEPVGDREVSGGVERGEIPPASDDVETLRQELNQLRVDFEAFKQKVQSYFESDK